jgi:hypothetical protein
VPTLHVQDWGAAARLLGLTLNRLLGSVIFPIEGQENQMMKTWASCTFFYLIAVFATTLLPVPALGVTRRSSWPPTSRVTADSG